MGKAPQGQYPQQSKRPEGVDDLPGPDRIGTVQKGAKHKVPFANAWTLWLDCSLELVVCLQR